MKYLKATYLPVFLLPVFVFWSVLSFSQVKKYSLKQEKAAEMKRLGICFALEMEGVSENPPLSNSGICIDKFLESINLKPGNEWCAAFCQWAYRKAAGKISVNLNILRSGHSLTIFNHARLNGKRLKTNPERGDWVLFQRGESQKGHCAIILEIDGNTLKTIEGNVSNPERSNNGVFRRQHKINNYGWLHIVGFIGFEER